jgi:hypothetical protein
LETSYIFHIFGTPAARILFGEEAYAGSLWGGSIGGIVVGLLMIILVSLPLCCGVMKKQGKASESAQKYGDIIGI